MRYTWTVVVSNIGIVYEGNNGFQALRYYNIYTKESRTEQGRAGGEDVTILRNNDIFREHIGSITQEECST
jgi:hypothetical protein